MQLFIGGACAGKRDAVAARFPDALWHRLMPGQQLAACQQTLIADRPLVISGVLAWLEAALVNAENDPLRQQWQGDMTQLCQRAKQLNAALVIITTEVGRGIVPMQPEQRRLRDLNGWFNQDASVQAKQVWYVRHGLLMAIK
ncbi:MULTISPECIES: bifunctional adenosylcobinamide kinase/adenosylcobinamide-phosphate guanylyltransferase [unclassified Halomonas]|uniref:bifunctional adenosylcobinamide kinase/adenosylcobinamide-phosphate guanylyltransferase n=1 Tax=unclassified Halomonas TaxID=2609666 RepID=UPI0007D95449|nr:MULTISPECIES: bifunctional adenosylcobinamide kinase/adenosylcobinamide-phosphate guanylyltransferase [unclassified Halomonas]MBT2788457.1 bifunctional adenosylcobinamide kinase/adenosylcobinamide-phosphate guanylyltransferase [Halomonas sp. ISL-106]MBT2798048.1 bifunctional adenosylcobinamide kinase/adenosylcobinamide-phosphate guanylyltransferase [Halomonas sp. ISL-104]OAL60614.1 adenosylcobinamide kinase [Halomonas sp. ALS9]